MIQNKLPTANHVVQCKSQADFGDMTLVINGKDYVLSNEEWMFPSQQIQMRRSAMTMGPVGGPGKQITSFEEAETNSDAQKSEGNGGQVTACASTVMAMDISKEMFLVGDVFMRKFYTIFDRDNDRVGLAHAITMK